MNDSDRKIVKDHQCVVEGNQERCSGKNDLDLGAKVTVLSH
jgi:hypothetical protein